MRDDIIAALATAWGEGGIAIVRVSGEGSAKVVGKIFRSRGSFSEQPPRMMALGALVRRDGLQFDEALAVRFEAGHSYTGEESAELHCHGGAMAAQRCLEELFALGARMAEPGEFTRRAFLNGRIDLSQAEAVLGIIRARSDEALAASARTLHGEFTKKAESLSSEMTALAAALETDLDFPEEGEGFISSNEKEARLSELSRRCRELLDECRGGQLLREGVRCAITGAPNVGKSSLLNALLKRERAIVTPIPGTTRDSIEETFIYRGLPIRIIDTAGIRETEDEVEAIGVRRSLSSIEEADVTLWVVDSSEPPQSIALPPKAERLIVVLNKGDLPAQTTEAEIRSIIGPAAVAAVSAATGEGLEGLMEAVMAAVVGGAPLSSSYSVTARQTEALSIAWEAVKAALEAQTGGTGADVTISALAEARQALASLLGQDASEELVDKIFSSFCVGK